MSTVKDKSYSEAVTQRFLMAMKDIIAKGIKEVRNRSQFAELIGEYQQNLSKMEKGGRYPTIDSLAKICTEFGVSERWLLTSRGNMYASGAEPGQEPVAAKVLELENRLRKVEGYIRENGLKPAPVNKTVSKKR